jgi:hypothetical protein
MTIAQIYEKAKRQLDKDAITIGEFSEIVDREYQEPSKWIPVTERLPEDYIHVLCQFTLNGMGECYLAHGIFHVVGGVVMTCNEVIAWMPLPEPYKGSESK